VVEEEAVAIDVDGVVVVVVVAAAAAVALTDFRVDARPSRAHSATHTLSVTHVFQDVKPLTRTVE
jgi:hypothetical protein